MEEPIVRVEHLSHRYSVDWAIRDINFEVRNKGIFGLLGSNGAGKSTTMNIICGVLNQTEGDVYINGINLRENPVEAKKFIGFLPQKPPLYPNLSVEEYLTYCANLRLMNQTDIQEAVERAMERCCITHFRERLLRNLSGGYQQRVGIAQAIVHQPKFVVLDEPTNGLDPNQIVEIRNLIKEIATDHAVMLSTHILPEVEATCDEIRMVENGHIVFSGTIEDFNNYVAPTSFSLSLEKEVSPEELKLDGATAVDVLGGNNYRIHFNASNEDITEKYIAMNVSKHWGLKEIRVERLSLNEIFARLSGKVKTNVNND